MIIFRKVLRRLKTDMTNTFLSDLNNNLVSYRKQWLHIGTSVPALNRDSINGLLDSIYVMSGFERPKVIWCDSPLATIKKFMVNKSAAIFERFNRVIDI